MSNSLSSAALEVLLTEYRECAASYRHTYATIWQAGGILGAASAALLAFSGGWVVFIAPLPILAWYLALYLPMDAYGEQRRQRLRELEEALSQGVPGAEMHHFRSYGTDSPSGAKNPPWRVKQALAVIMVLLALAQFGLLLLALLRWTMALGG